MREKRIFALFLSAVMAALLCACGNGIPDTTEAVNIGQQREETQEEQTEGPTEEKQREEQQTEEAEEREEEMTVYEFADAFTTVKDMKAGWNLGNALDSTGEFTRDYTPEEVEKSWGNPAVTKELIQAVKEGGFHTVRVPVTWNLRFDPEDYTIEEDWLQRVTEVVDYVIGEDMYCIINLHHDTGGDGWLKATTESWDSCSRQYEALWRQIAEHFKEYDNHLLFEDFNEILDEHNSWNTTDAESYAVLNRFNQLFVDTVRATGGNNAQRNLIVCTYACNCQERNLQNFCIPEDSAEDHIIMENHIYDPGWFTAQAGKVPERDWGTDEDKAEIDVLFKRIDKYAGDWNVPVIIGEFGAQDMSGNEENRADYVKYFVETAGEYGITCIYWDDGGSMKIIDRTTCEWTCPNARDAIVNAR